jgi:hypothetical protein
MNNSALTVHRSHITSYHISVFINLRPWRQSVTGIHLTRLSLSRSLISQMCFWLIAALNVCFAVNCLSFHLVFFFYSKPSICQVVLLVLNYEKLFENTRLLTFITVRCARENNVCMYVCMYVFCFSRFLCVFKAATIRWSNLAGTYNSVDCLIFLCITEVCLLTYLLKLSLKC